MAMSSAARQLGLAVPFRPNTPLRKQLGWHIQQGTVHGAVMTITPNDAKELLARNQGEGWKNRVVSRSTVDRYAKEMTEGRWRLTGEGLIVDKNGKLLNGQHRLLACIKCGIPLVTIIVFGVEPAAFSVIDRGNVRTAASVFDIAGIQYYSRCSAATVWVWKYLTGHMPHGGSSNPTPEQLLAYFRDEHPGLVDSIHITSAFDVTKEKLARGSLMMALHYLCAKQSPLLADNFFKAVASGLNVRSKRAPTFKLRARLLQARLARASILPHVVAAMVINAWNAERQGRSLTEEALSYDPSKPFPTII